MACLAQKQCAGHVLLLTLVLSRMHLNSGQHMLNSGQHVLLQGNVTVVGLFQLLQNSQGACSVYVDVESVMLAEAVKWYIDRLNTANSLPFKIGLKGYPTCRATDIAARAAINIIQESMNSPNNTIVGIIGPSFSSEAEVVSSILGTVEPESRLVQVGISTTAPGLGDAQKFPNFVRVIPDDTVQIKVMIKTMLHLEWNRIAIVYENDTYGQAGARLLTEQAAQFDICVAYTAALDVQYGISSSRITEIRNDITIGKGSIVHVEGVVIIGIETTVNLLMLSFQNSGLSRTPAVMVSEAIDLQPSTFEDKGSPINKAKGAFVMTPAYAEITEFTEHWKSIFTNRSIYTREVASNPFLKQTIEQLTSCDPGSGSCSVNQSRVDALFPMQPLYIKYAILATHAVAKALKSLYIKECGTIGNACPNFTTNFKPGAMIDAVKGSTLSFADDFPYKVSSLASQNLQIHFDTNGEVVTGPSTPSYQVYNYINNDNKPDKFNLVKVGEFFGDDVSLNQSTVRDYLPNGTSVSWLGRRKPRCPEGALCAECIPDDLPEWTIFQPGDVYVVALVPVYDNNPPVGCSKLRLLNGYQVAEAISFAVKQFNDKTGIYSTHFPNIKVGLIILNTCNNGIVIQRKLLNLNYEGIRLPDGSVVSMAGKILGYVGPLGSAISIASSGVLSKLGQVQISYASTNPSLSDRTVHPYFMRVVTPDDAQAIAMVSIVKAMKADYIQIIYSSGAYGEGGYNHVKQEAYANDICLVQGIKVEEDGNYNSIFDELRRYPQARIVLVFLRSHVVLPVMTSLTKQLKRGDFIFIGSEAFAKNQYVLDRDTRLTTLGSLTLVQEMARNQELDTDIRQAIQPVAYRENPWSRDYLQVRLNCSYSTSYDRTRERDCSNVTSLQTDPSFVLDTWSVTAYNAMIALLLGSSDFLKNKCGADATKLCEEYLDNPQGLITELKKVRLDLSGSGTPMKVFSDNGDGNSGFQIYNIQKDLDHPQKLVYVKVGQYPLQGGLQFDKLLVRTPDDSPVVSVCPNAQACSSCIQQAEPLANTTEKETGLIAIFLGVLFGLFLLTTIALVIVLVIIKRNQANANEVYLTPADVSSPYASTSSSNMVDMSSTSGGFCRTVSDDEFSGRLPETCY